MGSKWQVHWSLTWTKGNNSGARGMPTQLEAVHLAQEGRTPGIAHPDDKDHTGRASPALDSRSRCRLRWGLPHPPPAGLTWAQPREGRHGDCETKTSLWIHSCQEISTFDGVSQTRLGESHVWMCLVFNWLGFRARNVSNCSNYEKLTFTHSSLPLRKLVPATQNQTSQFCGNLWDRVTCA